MNAGLGNGERIATLHAVQSKVMQECRICDIVKVKVKYREVKVIVKCKVEATLTYAEVRAKQH